MSLTGMSFPASVPTDCFPAFTAALFIFIMQIYQAGLSGDDRVKNFLHSPMNAIMGIADIQLQDETHTPLIKEAFA
jgi:hypothetical protein